MNYNLAVNKFNDDLQAKKTTNECTL